MAVKISEHEHQVNVIKWFNLQYKQFSGRLYANANGGQRNIVVAIKLKAEGVSAGVPDLTLPVARNGYHGLYVEMKAGKGRLSETQSEWINFLCEQGYYTAVCYGFDEAKLMITNYLS